LSLLEEQQATVSNEMLKAFIFLLNSTSVTKHTEFIYEMALNKFILKFNKLFFNDSKPATSLSLKKSRFGGGNSSPCDLLNNLNKNVLIDILKSNYLNINELNLFKLCIKWSKNRIEEDKRNERLNGEENDEIQYLLTTTITRGSPTKKLKNLFRLSPNSSFKFVKIKKNFSKILTKQKIYDDFIIYNENEENSDGEKLMCLLNELVKYLNINLLISELNYLIDRVSIVEPESQYYCQEYNYLMNIINNLNDDLVASDNCQNQPDFIVNNNNNNKKLKTCRLNTKPIRLNNYLIDKLSKYLSQSFDEPEIINLPDMINSTLSSRNEDNSNNDSLTGGNNFSFIFSKNDVEIYRKLMSRFYELKNFYDSLYKHKKSDKFSLDKILKWKIYREFGFSNLSFNDSFFEYLCKKFDFFIFNFEKV